MGATRAAPGYSSSSESEPNGIMSRRPVFSSSSLLQSIIPCRLGRAKSGSLATLGSRNRLWPPLELSLQAAKSSARREAALKSTDRGVLT